MQRSADKRGGMNTGLFPMPAGRGLSLRNRHRAEKKRKLDAFAELLAEGHEPGAAAVILGHMPSYGPILLRMIRQQLGWQAR